MRGTITLIYAENYRNMATLHLQEPKTVFSFDHSLQNEHWRFRECHQKISCYMFLDWFLKILQRMHLLRVKLDWFAFSNTDNIFGPHINQGSGKSSKLPRIVQLKLAFGKKSTSNQKLFSTNMLINYIVL